MTEIFAAAHVATHAATHCVTHCVTHAALVAHAAVKIGVCVIFCGGVKRLGLVVVGGFSRLAVTQLLKRHKPVVKAAQFVALVVFGAA